MGVSISDHPEKEQRHTTLCRHENGQQSNERERLSTPTIDDLIHKLNGTTVFSKFDLRSGYHQIPLDPESRYITKVQ